MTSFTFSGRRILEIADVGQRKELEEWMQANGISYSVYAFTHVEIGLDGLTGKEVEVKEPRLMIQYEGEPEDETAFSLRWSGSSSANTG